MNKVILMGRLTRDPDIRYGGQDNQTAIARFSLAVDRRIKTNNGPEADFFNCTAFGKLGEFAEKYLRQGTKVVATGRIQNDNYTDRNGQKVYSVQIMIEEMEFAESKTQNDQANNQGTQQGFAQPEYQAQQPQGYPTPAPQGFAPSQAPVPQQFAQPSFMNIPDNVDDGELPFN